MELMEQEGQGASIKSWLQRINEEASQLNIKVDINVNEIDIEHITPWEVRLSINMTSFIADSRGLAYWNITNKYSEQFSILGFEDPLYTIETNDKITVLVNQTPNMTFVNKLTNDTSILDNHIVNNYYINNTLAPSFLMRFSGNLSSSEFGIESMVYPEDISAQVESGFDTSRSLIDYIYFGNQSTSDFCNFQNMSSWFRLDEDHLDFYEVGSLAYVNCT